MKKQINYYFFAVVAILITGGMLFLANLSAPVSLKIFNTPNYYLRHQFFALLAGLVLFLLSLKLPLKFFKKAALIIFLINVILSVMVIFPGIGLKLGGARRWLNLGGISFQPAEFLKITSILYISALLSNKFSDSFRKNWLANIKKSYNNFIKVFLPFLLLLTVIAMILVLQKDLSTLGIVSLTLLTVYFLAGTPIWHTLFLGIISTIGATIFITIEPYRIQRLLVLLNPETDPLGIGLQAKQSIIAIGSGGIFGQGLGMSTQKFGFLPQAMTDSIFAILGEETGIIGSIIVIMLFLAFLYLGFKIAKRANDKFSQLTAVGITTWITVQTFVNITSAIGLFPLSGIPLPFFSYGGSHLVAEMIAVGILLNISKNKTANP